LNKDCLHTTQTTHQQNELLVKRCVALIRIAALYKNQVRTYIHTYIHTKCANFSQYQGSLVFCLLAGSRHPTLSQYPILTSFTASFCCIVIFWENRWGGSCCLRQMCFYIKWHHHWFMHHSVPFPRPSKWQSICKDFWC